MKLKLLILGMVVWVGPSAPAQTFTNAPLLHLSFDNVSGSTVINDGAGGAALNGSLIGTASIVSGGKFGNCLGISGANAAAGYCKVANAVVPLNVGAGNNWTVAMWIKTSTAGGVYGYQGDGGWAGGNTTFYLNNGGYATSGTQAGGVRYGQGNEAGATPELNDNNWHHVTMTCSGTSKTLYVDGSINSLTTDQWNGGGTGGQFWIGGSGDPQDGGNNLNGYVDEVYVFNGTLNVGQIQSLYLSNSAPSGLANSKNSYQPTWASVDQHNAAPEWFQDAKFGIYFHWGVFSVPAYGTEWYPRNMYNTGDPTYVHHTNTFGNPFGNNPPPFFPYDYFITAGHTNLAGTTNWQFAPVLRSQGGSWDPDAWAQLFVNAGAKFAGPVAEHHDGYSMWNSSANEWNSVNDGPHQDLASIWATAIRAKGLKFLMAMHHAFNFLGYYQYVPAQTNASLQKLYGQLSSAAENQLWSAKLKEIIDGYQPDIIWQDFDLSRVNETQRLNFLSYYYNSALSWNKEVVATYKDGFDSNGEVFDFERGGPGNLLSPCWLTDDSISSNSWCYVSGMGYYSTNAMICALIDRVSKGGNMLLNISPMADGTIPQAQQNILLGMGDWLGRFGECIYSNRAWVVYGEGPTAMGGGSFVAPVAGTSADIRFMRNKATNALYAIVMGWPGSQLNITTLNSASINLTTLTNVQLLGATAGTYINLPTRVQDANGLKIILPSQPYNAIAYALKLSFSGAIPAYTPVVLPLLHVSFDNVSGATVINDGAGGVALNGTLIGTASIAAGGKFGNCLHITGANAAAAFCAVSNSVVPLSAGVGNSWTVAMWIKTATAGGAYGYQGDGGWANGNTMFYLNNGGYTTSGTQAGGVRYGQGNEAGTTSGLNDGSWHHVAMTCSGRTKALYLDGTVDSLAADQWHGSGTGGQFWIGGSAVAGNAENNLNGYVDEVYVYNGALNASQIQSLYVSNNINNTNVIVLGPAAGDLHIGPTGTSTSVNNTNNNWRHVSGNAQDSETFDTNTQPASGDTSGSVHVQFTFNPSNGANNFVSLEDNYGDIYGNGLGPAGAFNSQLYATIEMDFKYDSSSTMPIAYSTGNNGVGALQIGLSALWNPVVAETNLDLSTINDGNWHHLSVPIDPHNMPTTCWGVYFYIWHGNPPYDPAGTVKFWVANIVIRALLVPQVPGPVVWTNTAQPLTARVSDLVSRLTVPEEVGLLLGDANSEPVPVPRLGIPGYGWWSEALHGIGWGYPSTVFPQAIGMAATWDAPLIQNEADVISTQARAYNNDYRYANNGESRNGIGLTYWSPNINICRDPRWGRNQETYGEDPFLEGAITVAYVNGMQGTNPTYLKTSACVKHFVCYAGPEPGRLSQDTEPPQRDLYETYLPPFETAVRQGRVSGVMGAYPSLYGVPQCASTNLISGILRTSWGFDGYVVCDCDAIGNIWSAFNYVATPEAAAAMGVNGGNDVDCGGTFNYLTQALQEGLTSVDNINQAVSHALKMRFRLGLFDPTNFVPWSSYGVAQNVNTPAQHSLALTVAEESMVLLKNNGVLPLDRTKIHNLAVIGANATDTNMLVGNYNGTPFNPVTILAGIQQLAGPNIQVTYTLGCPLALANSGTNAPTPQMTQAALAAATNADAVIYVGGLNAQLESEDNWNVPFIGFNQGDRSQIELPSPQDSLLHALQATGKPVIVVNCSGDAIAMPWEATNVSAILQAWYPGEQGGTAVAEVLFGVVNPAGRLPVTFYAATTDLPTFTNYSMASRTYRYFNGMPLWAFGHGLSYSSFNYQSAQLDKSRASSGDQLNLTFTLQNTGTRDGDEVPQCYFRHLNSLVPQPIMALCGFKRVHLAAGQTTQVTMQIPAQQFRYWNTNQNQYVVEPGNYQLLVGAASDDIRLTLPLQVTLPPLSLSTASNVVALTWNATSNSVYQLQYTTKLAAAFWQNLGSPMVATNGMIYTTDSPSTTGQKFYRVQLVQ